MDRKIGNTCIMTALLLIALATTISVSIGKTSETVNPNNPPLSSLTPPPTQWNLTSNTFPGLQSFEDSISAGCNSTELVIGVNELPGVNVEVVEAAERFGGRLVNTVSTKTEVMAVVVEMPSDNVAFLEKEVSEKGLARYVEPNIRFQATFEPNDPYWPTQWGPKEIEANYAWNTTTGSSSILVAILDTGVDYDHPDIASNYLPLGRNWISNNPDPLDDYGHGTHCAGIIAGVLNNSIGISGVAQVHIMSEKVLDNYGSGFEDWIASGIFHATDQGANIISMSFGGYTVGGLMHDAIKYAFAHGVLLIAAAGNANSATKFYPASYDEVVSVAATDQYDNKADFSNYGNWIELAAPGVDIYSTTPHYHVTMNEMGYSMDYSSASGTSMACPHVAGVAALIWSKFPNATRDWVRAQLRVTSDDLGASGFDEYFGFGRINARKAVEPAPEHDLLILNRNLYDTYNYTLSRPHCELPRLFQPGEDICFDATVLNRGAADENHVMVELLVDGDSVNSTVINYFMSGTSVNVDLSWVPTSEKTYNVTLYVMPIQGEAADEYNALTGTINVRVPIGHVLFDEVHGQFTVPPITWWYGSWMESMVDRGYTVDVSDEGLIQPQTLANCSVFVVPRLVCSYSPDEILAVQDYVLGGGGLLFAGGGPDTEFGVPSRWGTSVTEFAGIKWAGTARIWMYNTSSIVQHPVTEGVSLAFFGAPQKRLYVTSPAVGLIFDNIGYGQIALAVSEIGAGRVVALCDGSIIYDPMGFIYTADNLHLANNMIDWLSGAPCSHDLLAKLENPYDLEPGESTVLNATVDNRGLSDETNVTIQILVNDTLVNSVTIPELASRQSYTVSCPWTSPNAIVACNVTAYVQSIPNESVITNNARSRFVQVHYPLFEPAEGQFAYYTDCCYDKAGHLMYQFYQNFTYQNYVSAHEINVTLRYTSWDLEVPSGKVYVSNLIVDTMNRLVSGGGWSNFWYPMWVETNISQDSTVNLWDEPATVTASRLFKNVIDCWEIPYPTWYGKQVPLYDKVSGLLIKNEYVYSYNRAFDVHFPYYREVLRLIDTNIQLSTDERDVAVVNLTCPRAFVRQNLSVPINVTVDNQGVYPETANITVFANSTPIITRTCWLDIGDSAVTELNYEWNTTGFAYGNYTLEATVSLSEETNTSNNRCSNGWIIVSDPPVANFDLSPSLPRTGEQMTFDASSSLAGWNGTNTLVLYGWDFGDGSIIVTPSALIEHAYAVSTTYNVTLTVTDSGDMTDSTWQQVSVQIMGDVNDDGRVDMRDVGIAVAAFNSTPNHPRWNAAADLDRNGRIDMRDICRAITNFGKVG